MRTLTQRKRYDNVISYSNANEHALSSRHRDRYHGRFYFTIFKVRTRNKWARLYISDVGSTLDRNGFM